MTSDYPIDLLVRAVVSLPFDLLVFYLGHRLGHLFFRQDIP